MNATADPGAATNVIPLRVQSAGEEGDHDRRLGRLAPFVAGLIALLALDDGVYDFDRWGLLAVAALAVFAGLLIAGRVGSFGTLTPTLLALLAIAVWASASMLWADSPDRAWTESTRLVLYIAVFAICAVVLRTPRAAQRSVLVIGAVIGAAALWTALALLRGDPGAFLDHRLDMPVGYINGTAGLFLIGLWPLMSVAERGGHPALAGASIAVAVLVANLLVLTQSRAVVPAVLLSMCVLLALYPGRTGRLWTLLIVGASVAAASPWTLDIYADRVPGQPRPVPDDLAQGAAIAALLAAVVVGGIWMAVTALRRRLDSPRSRRVATVGAACAVVCVIAAALVASGNPVDRVQREWRAFRTLNATETSSSRFTGAGGFRYDLWRIAVDDLKRDPLLGVGAGSYGLSYFQERRQEEPIRQPHSLPLQIVGELGIVGGVLALLALFAVAGAVIRSRRSNVVAGVAGAGMAVSWATQTSLDWLYNLPGITCIAIMGIVAASGTRTFVPLADERRRRWLLIGGALLVAISAASIGRQYSAHVFADRARDALPGDPAKALEATATSLKLNPHATETMYARAAAYARRDDYPRARDALMRAAAQEPLNFVPWALMGDLAARRGEIAQARTDYGRALRLNPRETQLRELATDPTRVLP